jgi:hypothetical protein
MYCSLLHCRTTSLAFCPAGPQNTVLINLPGFAMAEEFERRSDELIAAGRFLFERRWVPATSGNSSARLGDGALALTVSGCHKGD